MDRHCALPDPCKLRMIAKLDKVHSNMGVQTPPKLLKEPLFGQLSSVDQGADLVDHVKEVDQSAVTCVEGAEGGRDLLQGNGQNWVQSDTQVELQGANIATEVENSWYQNLLSSTS